ncbi:FBP domain-containing protein [Actinosynnema sp. CA-248983]
MSSAGDAFVAVALRMATPHGTARRTMCAICLTTHPGDGVSLMTARQAGKEGQRGNPVGTNLCGDLACSRYLRGKEDAGPGGRIHEALSIGEKAERTGTHLGAFLERVMY